MQMRCLRRTTGLAAQQPAVAVQQRPQLLVAVAAAAVELVQRTVESRIPPAVELQPAVVHKVVRMEPVPLLVDTVLAVDNTEVNMVLVQDTHWVLNQQWDTELMQRVAASRTNVH